MKGYLLLLLVFMTLAELCAIESKNRFSIYADIAADDSYAGLDWAMELSESREFDLFRISGEYSLYSRYQSKWEDGQSADLDFESYRYYVNLSRPQTELRVGMQRLSFGSAQVLRPLMWFDRVDPMDPYQVTKGVEAALFRHHWLNNANIWLWGVMGTRSTKGNEFAGGKNNALEYGGRLQYPTYIGDAALSYHSRDLFLGHEHRLGMDLRMDYALGLWVEASASYFKDFPGSPTYTATGSIGADYVFDLGNGLALLGESMLHTVSEGDLAAISYEELAFATMADYPLGLLDSIRLLMSYTIENEEYIVTGSWRRTYDYIALDLGLSKTKSRGNSLNLMISATY